MDNSTIVVGDLNNGYKKQKEDQEECRIIENHKPTRQPTTAE